MEQYAKTRRARRHSSELNNVSSIRRSHRRLKSSVMDDRSRSIRLRKEALLSKLIIQIQSYLCEEFKNCCIKASKGDKHEIMKENDEAQQIIRNLVNAYRTRSYAELCAMIGSEPITGNLTGPIGQEYQFEIEAFWDGKKNGDIRLLGDISPNPDRPIFGSIPLLKWIPIFTPLATDDFIMSPSGGFVGE
jgi:hypothetical protein